MSETKKEQVPMNEVPMEELNISHGNWVESIMNVQGSSTSNQSETKKPRRIQRVSEMLRETKDFEKYCAPRVVSIGPYHCKVRKEGYYQNHKLQLVQKLKVKMANKFVSNNQQKLEGLYKKLFEKIKEVRECYEENSTKDFSEEALARMMLMDGCFILYYIKSVIEDEKKEEENEKELEMKSHHTAFVQQDLFLLENQLPFLVLDVLMNNSKTPKDEWMKKINMFIDHNVMAPPQNQKSKQRCCNFMMQARYKEEKLVGDMEADASSKKLDNKVEEVISPAHLLELLHQKLVGDMEAETCHPKHYTFRNVKELTEVGIHLKPSETNCLTKISYESCGMYGSLILPPITVDESTKAKFLNLIAYEMCPDAPNDFQWVTSYVCFLDSLIDHPEDVKLLRSAKILNNCLGSDDEVADLFNQIAIDLVPHPCAYSFVKGEIQKHYDDKGKTYMAQLKHQYFKNPWTVFALAGAILALFLSAVQAYFQVWSIPSECDGLCKHIRIVEHL
uniref:Uncharacterized protein n=1 Tax=Davidia involucrata TaxID=16924 RepID=A0A5B7CAH4_DAVIN